MAWEFDNDRPIYAQILEYIMMDIMSGKYRPGDKIPSVRELAQEASVNPNTMQKALTELERVGMVHTERTAGRYITEDLGMIQSAKYNIAKKYAADFIKKMKELGYSKSELNDLLDKHTELWEEEADG